MAPPEMSRAEQALAAVEAGNAAAVEEHWLACLEAGAAADPLLPRVADRLIQRRERDRAVALLQMTVGALEQAGAAGAAFPLVSRLAKLTPDEPGLRDRLLAAATAAFAGRPSAGIVQTLRLEGSADVRTLVDQLEAAVRFAPGDVVRHQGGWGLGRVTELDPTGLVLRVQFVEGGIRPFPVLTAGKFLARVPPDAFDWLAVAAPDRLKADAVSDPAGVVRRLLADRQGRLPQREIKSALVKAGVCSADGWTRFWNGARKGLTADPFVELPTGPNGQVRLRERPMSRGDEILEAIRRTPDLATRLRALRQALAHADGKAIAQRLADELATEARALPADAQAARVAITEAMATVAAAGATVQPAADVVALAADRAQAARMLAWITDAESRTAFLARVKAAHPKDWVVVAAAALDQGGEPEVGDELYAAATAAGLAAAFVQAVARSVTDRQNATATLWACSAILDGRLAGGGPLPDGADLVSRGLGFVTRASADAEWSRDPAPRTLLRRARGSVPVKGLLKFLSTRPENELPRLMRAVLNCTGLGPRFLTDVERWCMQHHPKLLAQESLETGGVSAEVIMVSPAGLARYESEFTTLMNVEFPKNAQDLGEAIAKGDLSENAEYEAARQRQQWLVARATQMKADLEKARPIELATLTPDKVAPGVSVTLKRDDGRAEGFTILGPWDVDVDRGIISYLSPLGNALLGRRAGETVRARLPDGDRTWQVVTVTLLREFPAPRGSDGAPA